MSLWTPSGEHEVPNTNESSSAGNKNTDGAATKDELAGAMGQEMTQEEQEAMAREFEETRQQIASTPAEQIITTHIIGLYELAVIHLKNEPPNLGYAKLAIDALAGIISGVGDSLGDYEGAMRNILSEIQMAYVKTAEMIQQAAADTNEGSVEKVEEEGIDSP